MNEQDQRYKEYRLTCAELDGFKVAIPKKLAMLVGHKLLPTYLTDGDLARVVRLLDNAQVVSYCRELAWQFARFPPHWEPEDVEKAMRAEAEEKAEALARVLIGTAERQEGMK